MAMSRDEVREILKELWDKAYCSNYVRDFYGVDQAITKLQTLYKPEQEKIELVCPFCGEDNFDLIGLKNHFP